MSDLVTIAKDGETLQVHSNAVEEHKKLGWTVFKVPETAPVIVATPAPLAPPPVAPAAKPQLGMPGKGKV